MSKVGRNEPPCPCGSGKKYKACCRDKNEPEKRPPAAGPPPVPAPAESRVTFMTSVDDDDDLDVASNRVGRLIKAGQLDAAEQAARELLARYPDVHDGHDRLGMVFEARGDAKQAAYHYRQVVAVVEQHPDQYDVAFADRFRRLADKLDPLP